MKRFHGGKQMEPKKLTQIVKIVTSCATVLLVLLVGIIVAEYIKINSLSKKIEDVTAEIDTLSQTQNQLENNMEYHASSIYIEDYARRELRMLDDGEVYIVVE